MRPRAPSMPYAPALALLLTLLGCRGPAPAAQATPAADGPPTATTAAAALPAATLTPLPTATHTFTVTPTAPPTTALPTATPTSTATRTPSPTPTATATPLPVAAIRVSDEWTGAPVAQAAIRLPGAAAPAAAEQVCDGAGEARFAVLHAGVYSLTVRADGYFSRTVALEIGPGENALDVALVPRTVARVTAGAGNLRAGPGTVYDVRGAVGEGDVLDVVGRSQDGEWLVVAVPGGLTLWLWSGLAEVEGPVDRVDIAPAPPTPTPRPTSTPAPTPTPTPSPTPAFEIFPETGIEPWNAEAFLVRLQQIHKAFYEFKIRFGTRRCGTYHLFRESCVTAAAYTDVPGDWYELYLEYRMLLEKAVKVSRPIYDVCLAGGGSITMEENDAVVEVIDKGELRLIEMVDEASRRLGH